MVEGMMIVLVALIITYFIARFFIKLLVKALTGEHVHTHKEDDSWSDTGDGSGVNYVRMADGSVRID